jgi:hypothetical protein
MIKDWLAEYNPKNKDEAQATFREIMCPMRGHIGNAFPQMRWIELTLIHAEPIGEDQRVF